MDPLLRLLLTASAALLLMVTSLSVVAFRLPHGEWVLSPTGVYTRLMVWRRCRRGVVRGPDLRDWLETTRRGQWLYIRQGHRLVDYLTHMAPLDGSPPDPDARAREAVAVAAILDWLRQRDDWKFLLVCLDARLTPGELRAHLDGTAVLNRRSVRTLRALLPDSTGVWDRDWARLDR